MTVREIIEQELRGNPWMRERSNKDHGMAQLLSLRYGLGERGVSLDTITALIRDYGGMDRAWRRTLQENPELRGSDYEKDGAKDRLEQKKMLELGYEVGNPKKEISREADRHPQEEHQQSIASLE